MCLLNYCQNLVNSRRCLHAQFAVTFVLVPFCSLFTGFGRNNLPVNPQLELAFGKKKKELITRQLSYERRSREFNLPNRQMIHLLKTITVLLLRICNRHIHIGIQPLCRKFAPRGPPTQTFGEYSPCRGLSHKTS